MKTFVICTLLLESNAFTSTKVSTQRGAVVSVPTSSMPTRASVQALKAISYIPSSTPSAVPSSPLFASAVTGSTKDNSSLLNKMTTSLVSTKNLVTTLIARVIDLLFSAVASAKSVLTPALVALFSLPVLSQLFSLCLFVVEMLKQYTERSALLQFFGGAMAPVFNIPKRISTFISNISKQKETVYVSSPLSQAAQMAEKEKGEISMQQLWQRHGISDDSDSGAASSSDSNSEPASPISTKVPLYSKSEVESLFREGREYASAKLQELDSLYEQAGFDADGNSGFQTPEAVSYFDRAVNSDGQDAAPNAGEGFISHSSALRRTYWPVKPVSSYRRR